MVRQEADHECDHCRLEPVQYVLAFLRSGLELHAQCKDHRLDPHPTLMELTPFQVFALSPLVGIA